MCIKINIKLIASRLACKCKVSDWSLQWLATVDVFVHDANSITIDWFDNQHELSFAATIIDIYVLFAKDKNVTWKSSEKGSQLTIAGNSACFVHGVASFH